MTTLQKIVAAAKKLKKQHPNKFSKWTDYIKAAAKTIKPVAKKAVKKVGAVKTKRKAAPATRHTDKGSHNVKIKVVSGIGNTDVSRLKEAVAVKNNLLKVLSTYKTIIPKYRTDYDKMMLRTIPQLIKNENKIITELKKKIK